MLRKIERLMRVDKYLYFENNQRSEITKTLSQDIVRELIQDRFITVQESENYASNEVMVRLTFDPEKKTRTILLNEPKKPEPKKSGESFRDNVFQSAMRKVQKLHESFKKSQDKIVVEDKEAESKKPVKRGEIVKTVEAPNGQKYAVDEHNNYYEVPPPPKLSKPPKKRNVYSGNTVHYPVHTGSVSMTANTGQIPYNEVVQQEPDPEPDPPSTMTPLQKNLHDAMKRREADG